MPQSILITGGAGFVGHHLVHYFLEHTDMEIISLDRLDTSGTLSRLAEVLSLKPEWNSRLRVVWHDLKAPINGITAAQIGSPNYILHLAAGSHVDRSIADPMLFVMDNVVGTCNILDFARGDKELSLFLYFSTDEIFGPAPEGVSYKEDDRYRSGNPYSATKAGAEELCIAYENTYKLPIVVTHAMNIFGIRQHPEKFIPKVILSVINGVEVPIHSNETKTEAGKRHYLNSEDLCDAIYYILSRHTFSSAWHGLSGEKFNLVGEKELDNLQLAQLIASYIGKPLLYKMVDFHSSRPGHDLRYSLDGSKMKAFGWSPQKPTEERLKEVVEWYLANQRWLHISATIERG